MRTKIYYPKAHITENLYTSGKEWMLESGEEYVGFYHRYIDGLILTGARYNEIESKKLIKYVDRIEQPDNYIYNQLKSFTTFSSPKFVSNAPTLEEYSEGKFTRYFLRASNSVSVTDIIEIDARQWKQWKQNGIDNKLYTVIELDWKLTGPKEDVIKENSIVYGVYNTNKRIVELKSTSFVNIQNYLTDYLEYTIYSPFTSEKIKNNFVSS
jgi:hypothetical protein